MLGSVKIYLKLIGIPLAIMLGYQLAIAPRISEIQEDWQFLHDARMIAVQNMQKAQKAQQQKDP